MTAATENRVPKISVVMSCYNKGRYLRETIPTVLNQSLGDFEFVIYDNRSTDDSVAILRDFDDPRIRLYQNSRNLGPQGSMNNCIEAARGEFLVFCHGDDLWQENFLECSVSYLERFPDINICHSSMHVVDDSGTKYPAAPAPGGEHQVIGHREALARLYKGSFLQTPTVVYRRAAMPYLDFRYTYVGDWDLYLRLAAAGNDFLFINQALMYYRNSEGSETSIGVRGGNLILESYLMLRNFFTSHPELRAGSRKAFSRLSSATLRRARSAESREQGYFLISCALFCNPLQVLNPVFHCYLLLALLFGPAGLRLIKTSKKKGGKK